MTDALVTIALAVGGIIAAFLFGTRKGKHDERATQIERQAKADAKATAKAKEAQDEVAGLSDADVDRRLRDRAGK